MHTNTSLWENDIAYNYIIHKGMCFILTKKLLLSAMLCLIFVMPISANNNLDQLRLYYYADADDEDLSYTYIIIPAALSITERTEIIFSIIFDDYFAHQNTYTPRGVQVLAIFVEGDHLTVDVCANILNYGGSYYEHRLITRLLQNVYALGFAHFTLLIDGSSTHLPEGSLLFNIPVLNNFME